MALSTIRLLSIQLIIALTLPLIPFVGNYSPTILILLSWVSLLIINAVYVFYVYWQQISYIEVFLHYRYEPRYELFRNKIIIDAGLLCSYYGLLIKEKINEYDKIKDSSNLIDHIVSAGLIIVIHLTFLAITYYYLILSTLNKSTKSIRSSFDTPQYELGIIKKLIEGIPLEKGTFVKIYSKRSDKKTLFVVDENNYQYEIPEDCIHELNNDVT